MPGLSPLVTRAGAPPESEERRLTTGKIPLPESQGATAAVITAAAPLIYGGVLVKLSGGPRSSTALHFTQQQAAALGGT